MLKNNGKKVSGNFVVPYMNGKYVVPVLVGVTAFIFYRYNTEAWQNFFQLKKNGEWLSPEQLTEKIPFLIFSIVLIGVTLLTFFRNLSTIPVLGLLSCLFLMTQLGVTNWMRFIIWLVVGLVIYFTFSKKNSKLENAGEQ